MAIDIFFHNLNPDLGFLVKVYSIVSLNSRLNIRYSESHAPSYSYKVLSHTLKQRATKQKNEQQECTHTKKLEHTRMLLLHILNSVSESIWVCVRFCCSSFSSWNDIEKSYIKQTEIVYKIEVKLNAKIHVHVSFSI